MSKRKIKVSIIPIIKINAKKILNYQKLDLHSNQFANRQF